MDKIKHCWSQKIAIIHHKIASILLILSGIYGLYLSIDDIIILGTRLSAFISPYFFNYFCLFLSIFQMYTAVCFLIRQKWAKTAILWILLVRFFMIYFDFIEAIPAIILLPYLLFIIPNNKIGRLFIENKDEVSSWDYDI